jgi:hypothetical protein
MKIIQTIPFGGTRQPCGIAATHNAVWVAVGAKYCDTIGS